MKQLMASRCFKDKRKVKLITPKPTLLDVNILGLRTVWVLVFLTCSILSLVWFGYFYCICALHIIVNNDILQRVLRAVTKNGNTHTHTHEHTHTYTHTHTHTHIHTHTHTHTYTLTHTHIHTHTHEHTYTHTHTHTHTHPHTHTHRHTHTHTHTHKHVFTTLHFPFFLLYRCCSDNGAYSRNYCAVHLLCYVLRFSLQ